MILLTGASQGIGLALAGALLERTEETVLLTGRCERRLAEAGAQLAVWGEARVRVQPCDQASYRAVRGLAEEIECGEIMLSGAVLGVGVNPMYDEGPHRLHRVSASTIAATIATNCGHATLLSVAILDHLARRRGGTLFWIGSQAARVGFPGAALYCGTKAFLGGLARAVDREYATLGIRAAVLHPGLVRTPRTAAIVDRFAAQHGITVCEPAAVATQIADLYCSAGPVPAEVEL